jgi:alkylmercury lyase
MQMRSAAEGARYVTNVAALSERFLALFPRLGPSGRAVAVCLYRLLARGRPVHPDALARAAGLERAEVDALLAAWHGVQRDGEAVTGFWGLTVRPGSPHVLQVDGVTLHAWCAWDTLFLPDLLAARAQVTSRDPVSGEPLRLVVTPEALESIEPAGAVLSMLEPREDMLADIVTRFCGHVHFFASPRSGEAWLSTHPGATLMSPADGHALGRLRNEGQFGEALRRPQP